MYTKIAYYHTWKYELVLTRKEGTNNIMVIFVKVPPEDLQCDILTNKAEDREEMGKGTANSPKFKKEEKPSFGRPPNFNSEQFKFKHDL